MKRPPRIVMTSGCWALLHRGHLNILWASKQLGHILIVGVVSDAGARAYKGAYPVENVQQRMEHIAQLGFVDVVVEQQTTDPTPLVERFRPDIFTHGDDWQELREGQATLSRLGVEWKLLPYTPDISTTILTRKSA